MASVTTDERINVVNEQRGAGVPAETPSNKLPSPTVAVGRPSFESDSQRLRVAESLRARDSFTVLAEGVTWSVGSAKKPCTLLHGVTAYFEPLTMTAIMGASGSGKSSFLDIISARKTQGTIGGRVLFNAQPQTAAFARQHVGYVEQNPALIPNLTCAEVMHYTAALQRPSGESREAKRRRVELLMDQLGLSHRADVIIGGELAKGLSGGETKRVTIALGMIREPEVLLLDEPTSGLDSATANDIMALLKGIAEGNHTVITAIHSPTTYTYSLFDKLLVISAGRVAFLGRASAIEDHLASFHFDRREGCSTCEWLVDMLAIKENCQAMTSSYADSPLMEANGKHVEDLLARVGAASLPVSTPSSSPAKFMASLHTHAPNPPNPSHAQKPLPTKPKRNSVWHEMVCLFRYRALKNWRTSEYLGARMGDKVLFLFVMVTIFWGIGRKQGPAGWQPSTSDIMSIPSVLFMTIVLPAFGAAGYMPSLMIERPIFVRERSDGNYIAASYLFYKVLEEFLVTVPVSLVFSAGIYYGIGLHGSFGLFWLLNLLVSNIGIILAYLVASIAPTVDFANAALPAYVAMSLFFIGLLVPYESIPLYWRWYSSIW